VNVDKQVEPERDDRRVLRRRRLLLWSSVPVLLVLCVAGKLLSLNILAGQAASAFETGNSAAVEAAAHALGLANVVELHKAPFAAGDGRALAGDYAAATLLFEDALAAVPRNSADECYIRVNLSLAIEKTGDEKLRTGDPALAASLYVEALGVVEAAPPGCSSGESSKDSGRRLSQAEERLNEKVAGTAAQAESPGESPQAEAPKEETAQQSQLEQLEENARQAQRERNAGREREEYLKDTDYGSGPDRPW
jgi:hypothetical protein